MRQWIGIGMVLFLFATGAGCTSKTTSDGNEVFFDGMIQLMDQGVYFMGRSVGQVKVVETGAGHVTRVRVTLDTDFKGDVGNNLVFFVNNGRLQAALLQGVGDVLESGTPLSGFASKAGLNWFKFKTLFNDRIIHATQRAMALKARFG
ncbi:MAG: hypothetical protein HKP58_19010 [Desulfatitalea sp.]|nr:hypothetical protein [Desulfatitalea sp.]NNK02506.1 hypothetical protein [Desulfatitalea sp.]